MRILRYRIRSRFVLVLGISLTAMMTSAFAQQDDRDSRDPTACLTASMTSDLSFPANEYILPARKKWEIDLFLQNLNNFDWDLSVIEIFGMPDPDGSFAHNLKLAERRAKEVRAFILSRGFPSFRVIAHTWNPKKSEFNPYTLWPVGKERPNLVILNALGIGKHHCEDEEYEIIVDGGVLPPPPPITFDKDER